MWVMDSLVRVLSQKAKEYDEITFISFVVDTLIGKNKGSYVVVLNYLGLDKDTDIAGLQNYLRGKNNARN